jgi:PAS domain S-box-containing protein
VSVARQQSAGASLAPGGDEVFRALSACSPVGIFMTDRQGRCTYTNPRYEAICGVSMAESLGEGWLRSIHPDDRAMAAAAWEQANAAGREYLIEPRVVRPDGAVRWVRVRAASLSDGQGAPIGHVGTVEDITERVEAHRRLRQRLTALTRVAASLTFDQSMEATLDALAAGVVEVTQAVACAVTLIDEEQGLFRLAGICGMPAGYAAAVEASYRAGANLSSIEAYRTRRPVRRTVRRDMLREPRRAAAHDLARDAAGDLSVWLPLVSRGRAIGTLNCCYPVGIEPDDEESAFLLVVADQAAVAVETARLFAAAQGKAALEERQKLARELHDSVSQALYGIGLGARTARALLDRDPARVAEPLDYVLSLAETGMAEMRALIFELRPESLREEGLVAAIEKQAIAARGRHGLAVSLDLDAEPHLPMPAKEALYRIVQEAMHNTVKHAHASAVAVRLGREGAGQTVLEIRDDGAGFDTGGAFPGHLGLRSMRERVERLGGSLEISSAPGCGTTIRAELPGAEKRGASSEERGPALS